MQIFYVILFASKFFMGIIFVKFDLFFIRIMQFPPQGWLRITLNHGSITQITILGDGSVLLKILGDSGFIPANKLTF